MSIKYKLIVSLGIFALFFLFLLYLINIAVIYPSHVRLEKEEAAQQVNRCMNLIQNETQMIDNICKNFSASQIIRENLQNPSPSSKESILQDPLQYFTELDFYMVCSSADDILLTYVKPESNHSAAKRDPAEQSVFVQSVIRRLQGCNTKDVSGLCLTTQGIILFSSKPVQYVRDSTNSQGRLVIGTFAEPGFVSKLRKLTNLDLSILPYQEKQRDILKENKEKFFSAYEEKSNSRLTVSKIILDIQNLPAFVLELTLSRNIFQHGNINFEYMVLIFGVGSILGIFLFYIFLQKKHQFAGAANYQ